MCHISYIARPNILSCDRTTMCHIFMCHIARPIDRTTYSRSHHRFSIAPPILDRWSYCCAIADSRSHHPTYCRAIARQCVIYCHVLLCGRSGHDNVSYIVTMCHILWHCRNASYIVVRSHAYRGIPRQYARSIQEDMKTPKDKRRGWCDINATVVMRHRIDVTVTSQNATLDKTLLTSRSPRSVLQWVESKVAFCDVTSTQRLMSHRGHLEVTAQNATLSFGQNVVDVEVTS